MSPLPSMRTFPRQYKALARHPRGHVCKDCKASKRKSLFICNTYHSPLSSALNKLPFNSSSLHSCSSSSTTIRCVSSESSAKLTPALSKATLALGSCIEVITVAAMCRLDSTVLRLKRSLDAHFFFCYHFVLIYASFHITATTIERTSD